MKKFKTILMLFVFVCSIVFITGCSKEENIVKYDIETIGMYDTKTGVLLKLGDTKSTIKKYLGNPDETIINTDRYDYLNVVYNGDNEVVSLNLDNVVYDGGNRFYIASGIGCESTVIDFQETYKEYTEEKDKFNRYVSSIKLIKENSYYTPLNDETNTSEQEKIKISMLYYDYENINSIRIEKIK